MTFTDWLDESMNRYRSQPPREATRESAIQFARGVFRRLDQYWGPTIWERNRGDWDVLVVLDACRYDLWQDVAPEYDLPARGSVWSNASCSIDWIQYNFADCPRRLPDVGYVTANPFADHDAGSARSADLADTNIGHFRPLYKTDWTQIDTDPPIETVPPGRVTDHAIDAWRRRDEFGISQLVVHYMQPHEPFIARPEWSHANPHDNPVLKNLVTEGYQAGTSPWQRMIDTGEVSPEEFWPVYKENLRWVLDDVAGRLLENLDANVVLSADHGNGLGEWGEWHHPPGAMGPAVRRVPWIRLECEDVHSERPTVDLSDTGEGVEGVVRERLDALGYR